MDKNFPVKSNGRIHGVTHHVPHRTRYRLASHHRNDEMVTQLHDSLKKVSGVRNVEFNERTGSLLIHHDEIPEIVNNLSCAFNEIAEDLFEELGEEDLAILPEVSLLARLVGKRFEKINQYLARRTNNYLDLKMLLPLIFLGGGLYQISREKGALSQMPAWVLFYYAYDSYLKFHGINKTASHSPGNGHKG